MITLECRPGPARSALPEVVYRMYLAADKAPDLILRGSAAWICAPAPVDALTAVTP